HRSRPVRRPRSPCGATGRLCSRCSGSAEPSPAAVPVAGRAAVAADLIRAGASAAPGGGVAVPVSAAVAAITVVAVVAVVVIIFAVVGGVLHRAKGDGGTWGDAGAGGRLGSADITFIRPVVFHRFADLDLEALRLQVLGGAVDAPPAHVRNRDPITVDLTLGR